MRPVGLPSYISKLWQPAGDEVQQLRSIGEQYAHLCKGVPDVSVVIPAYNEEGNILHTLASLAANRTSRSVEIIVVNNNSRDRTEALVTASGVRCVNELKQGITAARTAGLHAARGMVILNADADAIYPPDWVEHMAAPLDDKENAMTYGRFAFIPTGRTGRFTYFFYEYLADVLRLVNKYWKEEAVNVYGFNSGFRKEQGLAVDGYVHPPGANEDGYLALKLRNEGFGKLHYVTNLQALVWTADRRIEADGGVWMGLKKRLTRVFFPGRYSDGRTDL